MPIYNSAGGSRAFAASWILTLLAAVLCAGFSSLGQWQWQRGQQRKLQWDEFSRGASSSLALTGQRIEELPRFQAVQATGTYDTQHQFLLDNRSHEGHPGYEVLTPFTTSDGRTLLVNRGWLPFGGYRERLPEVSFTAMPNTTISGRISELPAPGLQSGRAAPVPAGQWPRVTTFPRMQELSRSLGRELAPRILLLDPRAPHGFVRDWRPPGMPPARHIAYAVQWWGLAALVAVLWFYFAMRRRRRT